MQKQNEEKNKKKKTRYRKIRSTISANSLCTKSLERRTAFVQLLNQTGTTQLHINIDINASRQTKHKTEPAGKGITPVR